MGRDLYTLVRYTPNADTLYISLHVHPSDDIGGLWEVLPAINLTALYLHLRKRPSNGYIPFIEQLLQENIRQSWKLLVRHSTNVALRLYILILSQARIYLCEQWPIHCYHSGWCNILETLTTLKELHVGAMLAAQLLKHWDREPSRMYK